MTAERLWQSVPRERRKTILLDSLYAVFDRRSGQTHLLASPLPEILAALDQGPASSSALLERLSADFDITGADAVAGVTARLEELSALGLVCAA